MIEEFILPWAPCEPGLENQLKKEMSAQHVLHGVSAKSVARRVDMDDVLFELSNFDYRYAVVHLTWAGYQFDSSFPFTTLYRDFQTWKEERMQTDAREYAR